MAALSSRLCGRQLPFFGAVILRLRLSRLHISSPNAIRLYTRKLARNKAVYSAPAVSAAQCFSKPVHYSMEWQSLGAPSAELTLDFTMPTGQSFRWRRTGKAEFTGVVDDLVVKVQQLANDVQYQVIARGESTDPSEDAAVLKDYFNLQACKLEDLCREWSSRDERFRKIHTYFPGARVLRQDPVECLFEFICSSNNHISRIHGMVERLCRDYGTPILHSTVPQLAGLENPASVKAEKPAEEYQQQQQQQQAGVPDLAFYAFPSLEQLSIASEAALRAEGFGYRAKFITGSVQALLAMPGGGRQWLLSLRAASYKEASEALCQLPGVGPKVAACICLFALDKYEAIPVDTHVWQLAVRYYTPHLKGKTMNKKIMVAVEQAFIERFGPWAGWAHNTLFISELASQRDRLPAHLQPGAKARPASKAPRLNPPAGVNDQAAVELRSLAASESVVAQVTTSKKRILSGRGAKTATGKTQDQAADGEGGINGEDAAAAGDLMSHGSHGSAEEQLSQRGRRSKTKPKAVRSSAADPGKLEPKTTYGSVDVAAAAAVDQAVEDGIKATRALTKRKR